jgi:superfamily I DNA/RNA helicase
VTDVVDYINRLFQDGVENVLVLSTIHKAKGREWEVVLWYDKANTCPSKWARQAWQREQEDHLCYVASTRAKSVLIDVLATAEEKGAKSPPAPAEQKAA